MNSLRNRVFLIGHLGQDPETKQIGNGKSLTKFSLATSDSYKNEKGEKITETQWHNLIAWGKVAELAEKFLDKGREVVIEGKLVTRNYVDKEGVKRYVTEVVVNELLLLSNKPKEKE